MNSDYPSAIQLLNSNSFPNRDGIKPTYITIHGTAGGSSALEIAQYFKSTEGTNNPVASNYIVDQEGTIYQTVLEKDGAWANGPINGVPTPNLPFRAAGDGIHRDDWWNPNINPNNQTISIEHVKPDDQNATALTVAQQAASFGLIADICKRNNIPARWADASGGITGHFSMDPVNRSHCPGTYPWDALWSFLEGETTVTIDLSNSTVASHFSGSGDVWQCKDNGFLIGHGILGFYQKFGGDALCGLTYLGLPTSNETSVLGHPGVVYQRFERGVVAYDGSKTLDNPPGSGNVYLMHIDSGIGQDPRIAQLQAQITTLQGENAALKALPSVANLLQINTWAAQIVKASQVQ